LTAVDELTKITGQKAVSTISKKDVASFKLRKGCLLDKGYFAWRKNV
jgi:ribosomal protein L5